MKKLIVNLFYIANYFICVIILFFIMTYILVPFLLMFTDICNKDMIKSLSFLMALVFGSVFVLISQNLIRLHLPIIWRVNNKWWDNFLCSIGSHRCKSICGRGCCWKCINDTCSDKKLSSRHR